MTTESAPVQFGRRPAQPGDYDFLRELHRSTMRAYVEPIWGWHEDEQRRRFDAHFDPATIEIITREGQDVGAVSIEKRDDALFLSNIQILPAFQGRGIGTAIIAEMLDAARALGIPATLRVLKNNMARRLYERLGFRTIGETETHYLMSTEPRRE